MAVKKIRRTRASVQKPVQQIKLNNVKKQVTSINVKDKKVFVIAQEIKFARLLSSNDKRIRDRVLKNLKKWLSVRSQSSFSFTKSDFMRLWKGLFYCMWMSDKPLIQEELAESLSKLVHCFNIKDILLYTTCTLETLGIEWIGIDQYRLDKFYMLVRRIIRQTFQICKKQLWDIKWMQDISKMFEKLLTNPKVCLGFRMHLIEVFLEELAKISAGNIPEDVVTELVKPFVTYFITVDDGRQIGHVVKHIFRYLIFQSDVGMDYMEKFQAWKTAGFPTGSIDVMNKIEVLDEDIEDDNAIETEKFQSQIEHDTNKPLDPRAGRVDVELPQIPFNPKKIAELLARYKFHPESTAKSRRFLRRLIEEFSELSQGKMPVGIKEVVTVETRKGDTDTKLAAMRLLEFEEELHSDNVQKQKRKINEQLILREKDKSTEEELNINTEHCMARVNNEVVKKKRNVQSKMSNTNNLLQANLQTSKENTIDLKDKKNNSMKMAREHDSDKLKKESTTNFNKLKENKTADAIASNIITSVKRKKSTKVKTSDKWEISDSLNSSSSLPLNSNSKEAYTKTTKKIIKSNKSNVSTRKNSIVNTDPMWLLPVLKKLKTEKNKIPNLKGQDKINTTTNLKKRVKIALQRNTAQHTSEYIMQIQNSPAIPFDANRKPRAGVLKASPIPSPINPFYKRSIA